MANDDINKTESFADLVKGVKRLTTDRVNLLQPTQKRILPERPTKTSNQTIVDFNDFNYRQLSELRESYFDPGLQKKLQRKIRQGSLLLDDRIDLHGCRQNQALEELAIFFERVTDKGCRTVLIVHGKGQRSDINPVLKPLVQHWISRQNSILAWCPAQPKHGGSGATYLYLRASQNE